MICRNVSNGEKLNVGDLNEITVLVDRSETMMTEVAMNYWRNGLDGPPHSHGVKEQVFYITDGNGQVTVGNESYYVKPGSMIYIPKGVVHQTITKIDSVTYLLYNGFLDSNREGDATYADHIAKVKSIRQRQADTGDAGSDPDLSREISTKTPRAIDDARGTTSRMLLAHSDADRCEVERLAMGAGEIREQHHGDREQTLFVLSGRGTLNLGEEACELGPDVIAFVPMNAVQRLKAGKEGLIYLSFSTFIVE